MGITESSNVAGLAALLHTAPLVERAAPKAVTGGEQWAEGGVSSPHWLLAQSLYDCQQ